VRGTPEISVVVPTRDPTRSLERCLLALDAQTARERLEIVVVDDGSAVPDRVRAATAGFARELVRKEPGGVASARNAGGRVARAPIVCFTDDDCVPAPDWAARLAEAIGGGADVAGGVTVNGRPRDALAAASQEVVNYLAAGTADAMFLPGSNLACRADVLRAMPFDEAFRGAGEDREWCWRLAAGGYTLVVEPAAVVAHHQELTLPRFWRKHVRYGRGAWSFRRHRGDAWHLERPGFYAGLVRGGFELGAAAGLWVCVAQVATAVGFLLEAGSDASAGRLDG
jgi:GT2 family glycosyltransferase